MLCILYVFFASKFVSRNIQTRYIQYIQIHTHMHWNTFNIHTHMHSNTYTYANFGQTWCKLIHLSDINNANSVHTGLVQVPLHLHRRLHLHVVLKEAAAGRMWQRSGRAAAIKDQCYQYLKSWAHPRGDSGRPAAGQQSPAGLDNTWVLFLSHHPHKRAAILVTPFPPSFDPVRIDYECNLDAFRVKTSFVRLASSLHWCSIVAPTRWFPCWIFFE